MSAQCPSPRANDPAKPTVTGRSFRCWRRSARASSPIATPRGRWLSWWLAAIALATLWLPVWLLRLNRSAALLLLLALAATGGAWHHLQWRLFPEDEIGRAAGEESSPICLEVVALEGPRRRTAPAVDPMRTIPQGDQTRLEVAAVRARDGVRWIPALGKADLIVQGHLIDVRPGDRLRIFAHFAAPSTPSNPGEFDFAKFQRADGKLCLMRAEFPDCVERMQRGSAWNPRRLLAGVRTGGIELLKEHIHESRAPLASAILLGAREEVDPNREEDFFTTGSIHLLAISGLHVGILVAGFWLAARLRILDRRWAILGAAMFVIVYAVVTDARPPVVRATILVLSFCAAQWSLRRASALNSLALAGIVVIVLLGPARIFQVGTQLSFLAVAALIGGSRWIWPGGPVDPLDRLIARSRPWPTRMLRGAGASFWRLWLAGALVWSVALPLVLLRFHLFSPVALLLNPLLWIPIALALFSGFGVLAFGWIAPPLATLCGVVCDANLAAIEWLVTNARPLTGGHFFTAAPPVWWVIAFYAGLAAWAFFLRWRPPKRWLLAGGAAFCAIGLYTSPTFLDFAAGDRERLDCTFVDVGDGTAVVVSLPDGRTILYDAGSQRSPTSGARSIAAVLWSQGVTHLDAVIVSHADADHYNALPELLERFSVGEIYVSPVMFENVETSPGVAALREALEESGAPVRNMSSRDAPGRIGDVRIEVLHPPPKGVLGSDNANSIVLLLEYRGHRILLPGDLESPGLDDLLAERPLDCVVVMAPHHGSSRSNPAGFAAWSTPELVVISGGHARNVEQVEAAYREAGAEVAHTARAGAVRVTIDRAGVTARRWRQESW